jgi:hypothetical protein
VTINGRTVERCFFSQPTVGFAGAICIRTEPAADDGRDD